MSQNTARTTKLRCLIAGAVALFGCAHRPPAVPPAPAAGAGVPARVAATPAASLERLARLQAERRATATVGDYVLGPGDVISIRAFDLEQMNQRVRVDGDGTITLPLLGAVPVAGHSLAEVQRDLTGRLRAFMYDPSVTVFVEEYRSQQVAVVGAVQHPGLVPVTARDASIFDALSAAGGTTAEAGSRIYLVPVESRPHADGVAPALAEGAASAPAGTAVAMAEDAPIVVDTAQVAHQAQRLLYTLPVRAGDVIMVPTRGHVIVMGWVEKPGTYPLDAGLTLRGALGAAGGLSFPAKTSRMRVHRPGPNGATETRDVDYDAIVAHQAPDVPLYEGDVVEVDSSTPRLVPYAAYKLFTDLFRVGAGIRMAP
jgi:polysaccharide export outer membrane protein